MSDEEMLFIWDNVPTRGYGASHVLIVRADSYEKAMSIAVSTLENDKNYVLPTDVNKTETALMMADSPDVYYMSHFQGKVISVYE